MSVRSINTQQPSKKSSICWTHKDHRAKETTLLLLLGLRCGDEIIPRSFCRVTRLGSSRLSLCSSTTQQVRGSSSQVISQIVNFWWNIIISTRISDTFYAAIHIPFWALFPVFLDSRSVHIWSKCWGKKVEFEVNGILFMQNDVEHVVVLGCWTRKV